MSGKKQVNRLFVVGVAILCVALLIGLVGAVLTYTSLLNAKDSLIASKDLQISDEATKIGDLEALADEKQSEIDDLNSQITKKDTNIADLNQQLSQKDRQISSLNNQISQKDSTIASLKDQDSVIAELNEEISQKDNQIASLNSQISSLSNQIASLNSQIAQDNATIASLNDQITLLESETNSLTAEIADLNSQVLNLNSQIVSLQSQNANLTLQMAILNSELADLQWAFDIYVTAYQNLRDVVNQRADHTDLSDFIKPQDSAVVSVVYSVTGGWSDTSDWNEFWTDVKALYSWIRTNIKYRYDGLSPILPYNPASSLYYSAEMYQFPNETLELEKGDCEDQAILLCSMIRCYNNMNYAAHCIRIRGSTVGHVGVQIPVSGDKLVIFDPAGDYYSSNILGSIVYNDVSVEINNWLDYWKPQMGSNVYVYGVFSDNIEKEFSSTSEYLSWMYS